MKSIIDFLDAHGAILDESVYYNVGGPYPFTTDEFDAFTEEIWDNAGGSDSNKYLVKDSHFEEYDIPFDYEGKKYFLNVMYGQGSNWTLQTEAAREEYKKRVLDEEGTGFVI